MFHVSHYVCSQIFAVFGFLICVTTLLICSMLGVDIYNSRFRVDNVPLRIFFTGLYTHSHTGLANCDS